MKQHNHQNPSLHLFLALPLGLFPPTCPFITLFTRLPSFSIIFSLHISHLFFTCATTASCFNLSLIASFLTRSILLHQPHSSELSFLQLAISFYPCPSTPMSRNHTPGLVLPLHYTLSSCLHYPTLYSRRPFFLRDPTTVAALPILLSNSLSILPFSLNLIPRYTVSHACSICTPPTSILHSVGSLLNTMVLVFLQFIVKPCLFTASWNLPTFWLRSSAVWANITVSFAHIKIRMRQLSSSTPWNPSLTTLSRNMLNNNHGDKGHPCRRPYSTINSSVISPSTRTHVLLSLYNAFMDLRNFTLTPYLLNVAHKSALHTLSYAFSMSINAAYIFLSFLDTSPSTALSRRFGQCTLFRHPSSDLHNLQDVEEKGVTKELS